MARKTGRGLRRQLRHRRAARKRRAFKPFVAPTRPPPGTYDPALDAEERAAGRGFLDLQQDTERNQGRLFSDTYDPQLGAIPNLKRQLGEETVDYGNQLTGLHRGFQRLGIGQDMAARAAGVDEGGALVQAMRKRAANEQIAKAPIDLEHARFGQENARQTSKAGLDYLRANEDLTTGLARGGRELNFFRTDTGPQRFFQAEQSGADLPTRPKNERTRGGLTFRVRGAGGPTSKRRYVLPSGRLLRRKGFVRLMRRRRAGGSA